MEIILKLTYFISTDQLCGGSQLKDNQKLWNTRAVSIVLNKEIRKDEENLGRRAWDFEKKKTFQLVS